MPRYLDTRGSASLAIAICARCQMKHKYVNLMPDPNSPGLRVCRECIDIYDPWRLPPRQTEEVALENPRPDVPLTSP